MDTNQERNAVTGAYSYSGRYITQRLLAMGKRVLTLTGHPHRPDPFGGRVPAYAFDFDHPDRLARHLEGVTTLYNTYWVRFRYGEKTFAQAVENTLTLFDAAKKAGVQRIVHISITNPSVGSRLPYFRCKGVLERALDDSGLSYAIIRPTVLFGATPGEDVLLNNIAWLLRRFPIFAIMDDGQYRIQPVYVEDLAEIAVAAGQLTENVVLDAVGPEVFAFKDLVSLIAEKVNSRARIVHTAPWLALAASRLLSVFMGDVLLTRNEVVGLMAGLLESFEPPAGHTSLSAWLEQYGAQLGRIYSSELVRHYR